MRGELLLKLVESSGRDDEQPLLGSPVDRRHDGGAEAEVHGYDFISPLGDRLLTTIHEEEPELGTAPVSCSCDDACATASAWRARVALCKMILGAGAVALPRAFASLGLLLGTGALLLVAALTYYSVIAIISAAERRGGKGSYAELVAVEYGRAAGVFTRACTVVFGGGFLAIYLTIVADTLVGTRSVPGLLDDLLPGGVVPGSGGGVFLPDWALSRGFWVTVVVWVVLAPLVAPRSLSALAHSSALGLLAVTALALATAALAVLAGGRGEAARLSWLPDPRMLCCRGGLACTVAALAALPVVMTAFMCQFGVLGVAHDMQAKGAYSPRRMRAVVRWALAVAAAVYLAVGVGGYALFGDPEADVLANFGVEDLTPVVGMAGAKVVSAAVKLSYAATLLLTFPLLNMAVREDALAALAATAARPLPAAAYWVATYGLLAAYWLVAMAGASLWQVALLLGSSAGIQLAFVLPAALELAAARRRGAPRGAARLAAAAALVAIGVALTAAAVTSAVGHGRYRRDIGASAPDGFPQTPQP